MKRVVLTAAGIALAVLLLVVAAVLEFRITRFEPPAAAPEPSAGSDAVARGAYLARAGDCIACHSARGGTPYAGGYALRTPFGTFYAPNITPDNETGIGHWNADDFWQAMHHGKARDGSPLYPAFPYDNYTGVTRTDSDALFAYLRSLPPTRQVNLPHALEFPYNQRELLAGWRALYFKPAEFQADASHDAEWNRGAYLVNGLGHCSACHSERNLLGASDTKNPFAGGTLPISNWYAPPLTADAQTGLGTWSVEDIAALLQTGVSSRAAVYGPMAQVVRDSLQYLGNEDIRAMAVYLKAQGSKAGPAAVSEDPSPALLSAMETGAKIYESECKSCHQANGAGHPPAYPPLAGNGSVVTRTAINPIRLVLNGGFPPSTRSNPRPYGMPPFQYKLSDAEVAAVVTYIRRSWGNQASAVAPGEVERARSAPLD